MTRRAILEFSVFSFLDECDRLLLWTLDIWIAA